MDIQTGTGAAAHAILDREQLISHTRNALVDTIACLQSSDHGVIAALKVHELLTKTHEILDNAVFKWVGNMAHILAYLFNSASMQYYEVWASQFPILHSIEDSFPPSEAFLYRHSN